MILKGLFIYAAKSGLPFKEFSISMINNRYIDSWLLNHILLAESKDNADVRRFILDKRDYDLGNLLREIIKESIGFRRLYITYTKAKEGVTKKDVPDSEEISEQMSSRSSEREASSEDVQF